MSITTHIRRVQEAGELAWTEDRAKLSGVAASIRELSFWDEEEEAVQCLMRWARLDRGAEVGPLYALHIGGLAARRCADIATPQTLPTLMLELHHAPNPIRQGEILAALGTAGGEACLDILERADALGQHKASICSALAGLQAPAGEDILMSALAHPDPHARVAAGSVLARRAGEPEMGDARVARWMNVTFGKAPRFQSLDLLTHVAVEVRRGAVAKCCAKPKASILLALSLAWELDRALAARWRKDTPETPFDWGDWRGLIPSGPTGRGRARTAWAATLPKQKLTAALRLIQEQGAEEVAASYPADMLTLSDAALTQWDAREAKAVGAS